MYQTQFYYTTEKLNKLEAEHKKARAREACQNNDQITKLYWNQVAGRLVDQMELCQQVISDIKSEMAK